MSALKIVRAVLLASPALTKLLTNGADKSVVAGVLAPTTPLPAIGLTEVSAVDRQTLSKGAKVKVTSRVQVTVAAADVPAKDAIMREVRRQCFQFVGAAAGFTGVTAETSGRGPDFEMPGANFAMQTQDVKLTYDEDA